MYSKWGALLRIVDGYKFRLHKHLSDGLERWVCTDKKCKDFMNIDEFGETIEENHEHEHDSNPTGNL